MKTERRCTSGSPPSFEEMSDWISRQGRVSYGTDGVTGIERFLDGKTSSLVFGMGGVCAEWRNLGWSKEGFVRVLMDCVSVCGTDMSIFEAVKRREVSPGMINKISGHEGAGYIVATGKGVDPDWIGIYTPLESHVACGRNGHISYDRCAKSGKKCDAIVGAIRGPGLEDGTRGDSPDGYFGLLVDVSASSLPFDIAEAREFSRVVPRLAAASACESWGNIEMIIGKLKEKGLLQNTQKTALVVVGLGATGGVLAAIASHYGFRVFGVNPTERKRHFALKHKTCEFVADSIDTFAEEINGLLHTRVIDNVVVAEMSGQPIALEQSISFLRLLQLPADGQRGCIVFGLFDDKDILMPHVATRMSQREWVFQGRSERLGDGTWLESVVGRDPFAWRRLKNDLLNSVDHNGQTLLQQLNATVDVLTPEFPLRTLSGFANGGRVEIQGELARTNTLKLAVSFRHQMKLMMERG